LISFLKKYKEVAIATLLLIAALAVEYGFAFTGQFYVYLSLYLLSYLAVGGPVWLKAFQSIKKGTLFSEFFLMGIATVGAFAIGEYAEGVAVMLFYMVGEYAQHGAVDRASHSIKKLISQQPDTANVERNGKIAEVHPSEVEPGEIILVKPGEKVPLDGNLITAKASFNTAALTGESKPMARENGEEIWAGSINRLVPVRIEVTRPFEDTKLSHILELVQEASKRKAPTERFMTRFAKVYTPVVVWLAVALTFLPWLMVENYVFQEWFYRALVFLVVSCPCGLVISIPLGYFGGIGAASRNGILLKGSDFLDRLRSLNVLFMDKTGTLTEGRFEVQEIVSLNGYSKDELLGLAASLEQQSTHPIADAIINYKNGAVIYPVQKQQEISGKGLRGIIDQQQVLVGSRNLLLENGVSLDENDYSDPNTYVYVAVGKTHIGTIAIADRLKEDSLGAIAKLRELGVRQLTMLSGDNPKIVKHVAKQLQLDSAFGGLMPDEKYHKVKEALHPDRTVGFVGDGVNDAPVITLADVGIAMGGIGSDATVETADVVIQSDRPSKIPLAIEIARFTHKVVWQNIGIALGIKVAVMALALVGYASMWAAIFADVGVALIAIANAIRVQHTFSGESAPGLLSLWRTETPTQEPAACCEAC